MQPEPTQDNPTSSTTSPFLNQPTSSQNGCPDDQPDRTHGPRQEDRGRSSQPSALAGHASRETRSAAGEAAEIDDEARRLGSDRDSSEQSRASLDRIVAHEKVLTPSRRRNLQGPSFRVIGSRRGASPIEGPSPLASFPNGTDGQSFDTCKA